MLGCRNHQKLLSKELRTYTKISDARIVRSRETNWSALVQLPWLALVGKLEMVADLGVIGPHIARVLQTCSRGDEESQKENCELHFEVDIATK